jgi:hypothetical protein
MKSPGENENRSDPEEKAVEVTEFSVERNPNALSDPFDDYEDLAREGAELLSSGELNIEDFPAITG